jgi:hypothetical protein
MGIINRFATESYVATELNNISLDKTLSIEGVPADAKAVGDALAEKQPNGNYVKTVNGVAPDDSGNVAVPSGADGKTPERGVDYWTEADKAEIVADVLAGFPNTGDAATGRRLDFIQSSGSQYINTGVIPNATTEIEMQYSVQSILSNGCHMLSNSNFYFPFPRSYDGEYSFLASRLGRSLKITLVPTVNTIYTIKAFPSNKVIINGTEYGTLEHGGGTSTEPLYMNTFGGAPGNAAYTAPAKLYYCKIWQNGALVRDFIPYNSSSGEVGMLDLVENKLYKSDGTAQFTAGNLMGYVLRSDSVALPNAEGVSF